MYEYTQSKTKDKEKQTEGESIDQLAERAESQWNPLERLKSSYQRKQTTQGGMTYSVGPDGVVCSPKTTSRQVCERYSKRY
jgi:hypothetical protein